ncbi:hypothetical protein CLOM_g18221 [Closterium sp. NIES-68]|nr:hypothetical protein CLOM_g18221 [Closterium sp. NIES-68]
MWSRRRKPRLAKIEDEFPAGEGDQIVEESDPSVLPSVDGSPASSSAAASAAATAATPAAVGPATVPPAAAAAAAAATPTGPVTPEVRPGSVAEGGAERAESGVKDAERGTADGALEVKPSRAPDHSGGAINARVLEEDSENSIGRLVSDSRIAGGGRGGSEQHEAGPSLAAAAAAAAADGAGAGSEFLSETPRYILQAPDIVASGLEDELSLLERLVANHLVLSQFELARAAVRDLARLSPSRAISLLRRVIVTGGEIPGAVWSASVPSAAHLTWLCVGEYRELCKLHRPRGKTPDWARAARRGGSERDDWTGNGAEGEEREEEEREEGGEERGRRGTGESVEEERVMVDEAEFDLYLSEISLKVHESAAAQQTNPSIARTGEVEGSSGAGAGGEVQAGEDCRRRREEEVRAAVKLLHDRSAWGLPTRPLVVGSRSSASDRGKEAESGVSTVAAAAAGGEEASAEWEPGNVEIISDVTRASVSLVVGEYPEILDELCRNVLRQRRRRRMKDSEGHESEGNLPSKSWPSGVPAVRWVQGAHLGAVASLLEAGDIRGAAARLRYLNVDYGAVEEEQYRSALHQLVLALRPPVPEEAPCTSPVPGQAPCSPAELPLSPTRAPVWMAVRAEETKIAVQELLGSGSARVIKLFQATWDDYIHRELQLSAHHSPIAPPLEALHALLLLGDKPGQGRMTSAAGEASVQGAEEQGRGRADPQDAQDAGRGRRDGALAALHAGQFAKVNHILHLCPPLRPLTTLIAWDLIGPSRPASRLRLLWALWPNECARVLLPHTTSSQDGSGLEESQDTSLSSQLQHASVCCADLIFHAHLAFLMAARRAAFQQRQQHHQQEQEQHLKSQHQLFRHHGQQLHPSTDLASVLTPKAVARMVRAADPFTARLALELLQVQSPLHVLLALGAHCFQPEEIIQLVKAQPVSQHSTLSGTSARQWDVELLHMLFAAKAAEAAVRAMAGSEAGGGARTSKCEAVEAVESFERHAARVTTAARKVWMAHTVRSLLLAAESASPSSDPSTEGGPIPESSKASHKSRKSQGLSDEGCLATATMARLQLLSKHDDDQPDIDAAADLDAGAGGIGVPTTSSTGSTGNQSRAPVSAPTPASARSAPASPPAVVVMEFLLAAVARQMPRPGSEAHGIARPFLLDASPLSGVDRRAARALLKRKDVGEVGSGGFEAGSVAPSGAPAAAAAAAAAAAGVTAAAAAAAGTAPAAAAAAGGTAPAAGGTAPAAAAGTAPAAAPAGMIRAKSGEARGEKQLGQGRPEGGSSREGGGRREGGSEQGSESFRRKRRLTSGDGTGGTRTGWTRKREGRLRIRRRRLV